MHNKYQSVIILHTASGDYETSGTSGNNMRHLHKTIQGRAKNYRGKHTSVGYVHSVTVKTELCEEGHVVFEYASVLHSARKYWSHTKRFLVRKST